MRTNVVILIQFVCKEKNEQIFIEKKLLKKTNWAGLNLHSIVIMDHIEKF